MLYSNEEYYCKYYGRTRERYSYCYAYKCFEMRCLSTLTVSISFKMSSLSFITVNIFCCRPLSISQVSYFEFTIAALGTTLTSIRVHTFPKLHLLTLEYV